jgi:hypothetical protein
MILSTLPGYLKARPKSHKLGNITTRQHSGFVLAAFPRDYPITAPQRKVRDAAKECGIHTGISRNELVTKMIDCIGPKLRK